MYYDIQYIVFLYISNFIYYSFKIHKLYIELLNSDILLF